MTSILTERVVVEASYTKNKIDVALTQTPASVRINDDLGEISVSYEKNQAEVAVTTYPVEAFSERTDVLVQANYDKIEAELAVGMANLYPQITISFDDAPGDLTPGSIWLVIE
jgi:hypothetical protein